MKRTIAVMALCAAGVVFAAAERAMAEGSLKTSVEEAPGEWLMGTWVHQDAEGGTVRLVFSWDLGHHAILDHVVAPGRESRGITARNPVSGKLQYRGVDDRGGLATGTWSIGAERWVLRSEVFLPDGSRATFASLHVQEGSSSMKLAVYRVGAEGELEEPALLVRPYERGE